MSERPLELERRYDKAVSVARKDGDESPHLTGLYAVFLHGFGTQGRVPRWIAEKVCRTCHEYLAEHGAKPAQEEGET